MGQEESLVIRHLSAHVVSHTPWAHVFISHLRVPIHCYLIEK